MLRKLFIFIIFLLSLAILQSNKLEAGEKIVALKPSPTDEIFSQKLDLEAEILANYLAKFDSPLQYHAQDLVDAAKTYGLDWRMLPAIAGVESTFGRQTPGGYNAWGWGVYGDQAIYFGSFKEAIFTIAKGLREGYIDKGLKEPYAMNRVYAASPYWGGKVSYFMYDLERFAADYQAQKKNLTQRVTTPKIAAFSGQLVLR